LKIVVRTVAILALAGFYALRGWAGFIGFQYMVGLAWALGLVAALLWLRFTALLQLGVLVGAMAVWRWPIVVALFLAAPRIFLVLPGLISTFLASRRHPRARWQAKESLG
jgi:hypothetical protein